ncbi:MAG: S-layer homology domain-containing protein [Clostridia bacterium]|nr:S-layer homology domain-containing protein [Clostridia bacterium]
MKKTKRFLSLIFALLMMATCIPCNIVSAKEPDTIKVTFNANGGQGGFSGTFDNVLDIVTLGDGFRTKYMSENFSDIFGTIWTVYNDKDNYTTIYGATIDFSKVKTAEDVQRLKNLGFSATCNSCLGFVCFKFVEGTDFKLNHVDGIKFGDECSDHNDRSVQIEVGIDDCNNGSEVIKKIMVNSIAFNELLLKAAKHTENVHYDYGIDYTILTTNTTIDTISRSYQDTTKGGKTYRLTSGWNFAKKAGEQKYLTKEIERHLLLFGAEYDSQTETYGSLLYLTDPRADGGMPDALKNRTSEIYVRAIKEGIYYKALLEPITVPKTFSEKDFPNNPFLSPDGSKVFVGWTTVKNDPTTLITEEDITRNDDITVYALWEDLAVVEQPSSANNYKYKTNINDKWEHKNKLVEVLLKSDEAEVDPTFTPVDNFEGQGTYKYQLTYGTKTVETESFKYVPKSSKKYKATNTTDSGDKISGTGKKGSTRTVYTDEDKKVKDVIVKDKNGNEIEVIDNGDGTYSFKQPASDVTVEVIYGEKTLEEKMQDALSKDDVKVANSNEGAKINPNAKFVKGYDDGDFRPNDEVNNLELMCMVTQLFEDSGITISKEIDLKQGDNEWAGNIVALANGLDLIPGNKNDKNYDLYDGVTRGDLAIVVYNLIKDYTPSTSLNDRENCKDAIGKNYETAVAKLVELGVLKGFDDGLFHGENTLTRAEAVVVINRALRSLGFEIKVSNVQKSFPDLTEDHWAYIEIMFAANK